MRRANRLFDIIQILRDGRLHRASDIAERLKVSVRTIYRDMDTLVASGVPIEGARGVGYRTRDVVTLPALTLTPPEFEALQLGMAIVSEAADPDLKSAALSLAAKVDAVSPTQVVADPDTWKFAVYPFADAARGFSHMATVRSAIKSRQKLRLTHKQPDGSHAECVVRPLRMEHWGRVWTLTCWNETQEAFSDLRVDLIETATPLPELFIDEPGKNLAHRDATLSGGPSKSA